jgi:hypothetical protein
MGHRQAQSPTRGRGRVRLSDSAYKAATCRVGVVLFGKVRVSDRVTRRGPLKTDLRNAHTCLSMHSHRMSKEPFMLHFATDPCPPAPQPIADDERDAWLDDVRRWYYGGMEPGGDADSAAGQGIDHSLDGHKEAP